MKSHVKKTFQFAVSSIVSSYDDTGKYNERYQLRLRQQQPLQSRQQRKRTKRQQRKKRRKKQRRPKKQRSRELYL